MEKRGKESQRISSQTSQFLKKNPEIAKALRIFDMSFERYRMATEVTNFITDASTNPKSGGFSTRIMSKIA